MEAMDGLLPRRLAEKRNYSGEYSTEGAAPSVQSYGEEALQTRNSWSIQEQFSREKIWRRSLGQGEAFEILTVQFEEQFF